MSEQSDFIKRINELNELAADQENVIFEDQLYDIFPEVKDNEASKQVILDYLKEKKIGLGDKVNADDYMTDDEKSYLNFYLEDLMGAGTLSDGEREVYRKRAISGDPEAKTVVLNDYLINVVDIAKLYAGQGVLVEDLIGEANIALVMALDNLEALENADEVDGYFGKICMDTMQDLIGRRQDELNEDEKLLKKVNKVAKAAKELSAMLGRKVTVEELSVESGLSKAAILKALKLTANKIEEIETDGGDNNG